VVKLDLVQGGAGDGGKSARSSSTAPNNSTSMSGRGSGSSGSSSRAGGAQKGGRVVRRDGIPGLTSGELYFRCSQFEDARRRARGEDTSSSSSSSSSSSMGVSSCAAVLPATITAWLQGTDPTDAAVAEAKCNGALKHVATLRRHMSSARRERLAILGQEGTAGRVLCELVARHAHDASYGAASAMKEALGSLDARLMGLTVRYAALVEVRKEVLKASQKEGGRRQQGLTRLLRVIAGER
jgi:hypothetical protein